jgi:hypothetical protein
MKLATGALNSCVYAATHPIGEAKALVHARAQGVSSAVVGADAISVWDFTPDEKSTAAAQYRTDDLGADAQERLSRACTLACHQ